MIAYLLDTSVVVKWIVNERDTEKALKIQQAYLDGRVILIVPDLVFYEVANALKFSSHRVPEDEIKKYIESLVQIKLKVFPFDLEILLEALNFMRDYEITIYDAYFLALASITSSIFVTADHKLYIKVKPLSFVKLLSDL